jgi:hypothetical protein
MNEVIKDALSNAGRGKGTPNGERWAIYLDIEGTSNIFAADKGRFYQALNALLDGAGRLLPKVHPRVNAHQIGGDGFILVADSNEGKPEVPISIAVLLMQVLLINGSVGKGGISEGDFADHKSCLLALRNLHKVGDKTFSLGDGILTVFPVMGTALINAHRRKEHAPSGCLLAIDSAMLETKPEGVLLSQSGPDFAVIDWIHTRTATMDDMLKRTRLSLPAPSDLRNRLGAYVRGTGKLGEETWGRNSLVFNGCALSAEPRKQKIGSP